MSASPSGIFICSALFLLSTFSWSVMISKLWSLRRSRKNSEHFLEMFRGQQNPMEIYEMGHRFPNALNAHVYRMACRELSYYLLDSVEREGPRVKQVQLEPKISPVQMDSVYAAMDRAVGESIVHLEERTTILATAVSGAPFLGLLGTVWGVMDTFSGMAKETGASLQSIAPGVASALITTVIGLLVAIPAMFGYNFIVNRVRVMSAGLDNFAAELQTVLAKRFLADGLVGGGRALVCDPDVDEHLGLRPEVRQDPIHSRPPSPEPFEFSRDFDEIS